MSTRKLRVSLRWILCAGAALVLVSTIGCGGHKRAVVQGLSPGSSLEGKTSPEGLPAMEGLPAEAGLDYRESISLDDTLAELDAYPTPDGVDAELFAQLKAALGEALHQQWGASTSRSGVSCEFVGSPGLETDSPRGMGKIASTPPTGDENRVTDLAITDNGDGTFTLTWHYRNLGDYDQDGTVGISDITPLAQHFGQDAAPENEWIDGDLDGRVHISDITPIAMYYGVEVADYTVEGAVGAEGEFAEIDAVESGDATGKDTGRAEFEYALTPGENGYFRVVPRDGDGTPGDASNVVGLTLEVLSVSPLEVKEGTVVTFVAEVTGAGPFSYTWDFGGQAVPETSTEAEPEVVLTREVGDFPASLTVTNPQGDVIYPFTLTKLSREWKFEVLLTSMSISGPWPQLKIDESELWIHAGEDPFSSPPTANYVVHGASSVWDIEEVAFQGMLELNSDGRPGVAYRGGVLLDEVLSLAELIDGEWQTIELVGALGFSRVDFTYANGDEPFITFTLPNSAWIEYFWRRDGEWERGIVDEPYTSSRPGMSITTDPEGNPVLCYNAYKDGEFCECRIAWWNSDTAQWDIFVAEVTTVYYPAIDFNKDGYLCVAYSDNYEVEPDVYCYRLIYAVYDGEIWEKELVEELLPSSPYDKAYENTSLAHDATREPIIGVTDARESDCDLRLLWRRKGSWDIEVLAAQGTTGIHPSIAFDRDGNAYIAYYDGTEKEVIVGVYE